MKIQALLTAIAMNLKKLAAAILLIWSIIGNYAAHQRRRHAETTSSAAPIGPFSVGHARPVTGLGAAPRPQPPRSSAEIRTGPATPASLAR